jgi:hypothetical protein
MTAHDTGAQHLDRIVTLHNGLPKSYRNKD